MTKQVPLSKGQFALIDDEDYERVRQYKWCMGKDYAIRAARRADGTRDFIFMHRFILDVDAKQVDHINGNKLDNRRCNLRPATPSQNQGNSLPRGGSSKYKGVSWVKSRARWLAGIRTNCCPTKRLGFFRNEVDAALAYDQAAHAQWGEFAYLNFPERIR